jgi:hypothetical protein
MPAVSSYRSRSSLTCSPHEGGMMHLLLSRPCSGFATEPYGYERPRRERRSFKEEYDDGRCKYERKLEKSGEYKEKVKCRGGYRSSYRY